MAITLSQLQNYVDANIKQNGRNAITGNVMNYALQNTISLLSGKQDKLVSGTNIKTVNGTSLLGSGNVAITASLVVGSTAIGSGTDTRILFQSGGVLSQSAMLTFNDTGTAGSTTANFANTFNRTGNNFRIYGNNGATTLISSEGGGSGLYATSTYEIISTSGNNFNFRIGTGSPVSAMYINSSLYVGLGTTSPSSRLDIRAQGAASTDLAFRVRNSANTYDIFKIQGDGISRFEGITTFNWSASQTIAPIHIKSGGTNNDVTQWYNNSEISILDVRTASGGAQMQFKDNTGTTSLIISGQSSNVLTISEAKNVAFGTVTGTKWGTAITQKQSWWNATPVVQQILATGASHTVDDVITLLQTYGLCRQS